MVLSILLAGAIFCLPSETDVTEAPPPEEIWADDGLEYDGWEEEAWGENDWVWVDDRWADVAIDDSDELFIRESLETTWSNGTWGDEGWE